MKTSWLASSIFTLIDKIPTYLKKQNLLLAGIQTFLGEKGGPTSQEARRQK